MAKLNVKLPGGVEAGVEFNGSVFNPIIWIKNLFNSSNRQDKHNYKIIMKMIDHKMKLYFPKNAKIRKIELPIHRTKQELDQLFKEASIFGTSSDTYFLLMDKATEAADVQLKLLTDFYKKHGGIDNCCRDQEISYRIPKRFQHARENTAYIYEKNDKAIIMFVNWDIDTYGINGNEPSYCSICTIRKFLTDNFYL